MTDSQHIRRQLLNSIILISDIIGIFFALIYILFSCVLIVLGIGNTTLKLWMIAITGIYIVFSLFFIIFLGRGRRVKKAVKLFCKYLKYVMRLANMVLIFAVLVDMSFGNRILATIGIIVLIISFILHVFLDIIILLLKLALRNVAKNYKTAFENIRTDIKSSIENVKAAFQKPLIVNEVAELNVPIKEDSLTNEINSEEW